MSSFCLRDYNLDSDLGLFHMLNSDLSSMRMAGMTPCLNVEQSLARLNSRIKTNNEGSSFYKVVCCPETGELIGEIGLKNISDKHKRAELSLIFLPKHKNETNFINTLCSYCSNLLKESLVNRVQTIVNPHDRIAIKSYIQAGFIHEGTLRDYVSFGDEFLDMSILSLTRDRSQTRPEHSLFEKHDSIHFEKLFLEESPALYDPSHNLPRDPSFPKLESERLLLREHNDEDKDAYYRMMSNPDVVRYYGRPPMISRDSVERDYIRMRVLHNLGDTTRFAVVLKKNGEYIGTVGVHYFSSSKRGTLSCIIDRPYWRMGLATEALQLLMNYLFNKKSLHRLQVFVDPHNTPAVHFFEKNGFVAEAKLHQYENENGEFINLYLMSNLSLS